MRPQRTLHIKLVPKTTEKQRKGLQNRIASLLDDNGVVTDTILYAEVASSTVDMLMIFFYVLSGIAAMLCFFMLHVNFEANVRENLWEFGVLHALGVQASKVDVFCSYSWRDEALLLDFFDILRYWLQSIQLIRIFVYESLSVILGAITIGTGIGLVVASILTLQQQVFTELPFNFVFPGWLIGMMIALSIGVAALGAYIPVRTILDWSIARVIKHA